jgi:hypothetical protein
VDAIRSDGAASGRADVDLTSALFKQMTLAINALQRTNDNHG